MSCSMCKRGIDCDYILTCLADDMTLEICGSCAHTIPNLTVLEAEERERTRKRQEIYEKYLDALRQMREAPNRVEYKRLRDEMLATYERFC